MLVRSAVLALTVALTLTACGSSGGGGGNSPNTSGASTPSSVPSSPPSSPPSPPPSSPVASSGSTSGTGGTGGTADAATTAAVTKAYTTFFNYKSGLDVSEKLLQLGPEFHSALVTNAKTAAAQKITVTVSAVTLQSPHVAKVTFTVLGNGAALLPNTPGYAVQENGTWKVAAQTFCGLISLQGQAPAACQEPAVLSPSP
jgi:hypothetical protein